MRISDWSSDVCSSDLAPTVTLGVRGVEELELGATTDGRIVNNEVRIIDEATGALLGEAARICDVRFAANVAPEPACHFELDPAVLLDAHRTARNGGSRVVGHYHSHR